MSHSPEGKWYIWTVRPEKLNIIREYLEKTVSGVSNVVCPTVTSERKTKTGKVIKRTSLLYGSYIFVRYVHDSDNPTTWSKINEHPFVISYIGPCGPKDAVSLPT